MPLTGCISTISCWLFPRALLLWVPWVLPSLAQCLLLLGASDSGATRSGKHCWMSCQCSRSQSSFSCLERVLSATSRPPLQRMGHVHQTIGRREIGWIISHYGHRRAQNARGIGKHRPTSNSLSFLNLHLFVSFHLNGLFVGNYGQSKTSP